MVEKRFFSVRIAQGLILILLLLVGILASIHSTIGSAFDLSNASRCLEYLNVTASSAVDSPHIRFCHSIEMPNLWNIAWYFGTVTFVLALEGLLLELRRR